MRLPNFMDRCPAVKDQFVSVNGSRINLDHLYRVLRARATLEHLTLPPRTPLPKEAA